jgi:hypothetical protein
MMLIFFNIKKNYYFHLIPNYSALDYEASIPIVSNSIANYLI